MDWAPLTGLCVALSFQLHNVTLALELLKDHGLLHHPINPEGESSVGRWVPWVPRWPVL